MHVVIAVDGSEASRLLVNEVTARSWPKESRFDVLYVTEPSHLWAMSATVQDLAQRSAAVVREAVAALQKHGLTAETEERVGDPKSIIADYAKEVRAGLVVVGSHGTRGGARFLMGSVSAAVLRYSPCSVWIVRPRKEPAAQQRILLATDGSECSEAAARSVAKHPWPQGTEIQVLSVVEYSLPTATALFNVPILTAAHVEEVRTKAMLVAEEAVDVAAEIVSASCARVSQSISVLLERPQKIILDEAETWRADWIVLGSHGRQGLAHFLLGSVSEAVATHADCSVEVVREP
jgi:nucleotide-binding universal stress UspA family protein